MKKIYILTAVFALLTLSLNAQGFDKKKAKAIDKKEIVDAQKATFMPKSKVPMMSELLRGIKGMSSILPDWNPDGSTMANGQSRAPLMINSDEYTVGPFEGNNFNTNGGIGFGTAYPTNQDVLVTTVLNRDEFVQYNGDQIVGFRFALAGQTSTNNQVKVYDFISWPAGTNGYFETANSHEWNLGAYATTPVTTEYELINDDMTSTNFSTGSITASAPWSATSVRNQSNGSFYILDGGNLKFTIPSGYNNADFKFSFSTRDSYYSGYFTFTPSTGSAVTVNTSEANTVYECELTGLSSGDVVTITGRYSSNTYSPDFTYMHVYAKGGAGTPTSLMLTGGQWYEYYLDEPVDFVVNDTISNLFLGYRYEQYPSSSTNQLCYPIGVNPESTTHNHRALLNVPVSSSGDLVITVPGNTMNLRSITVYDTNNNTLTSWNANTYVNNGSYTAVDIDGDEYYAFNLPSGWTVDYDYLLIYGNSTNGYYGYLQGAGDITIASTALNGNTTVRVEISAFDDNGNVTMSVNNDGKTIGNSLSTYTWNSVNIGTTTYEYGFYPIDFSQYGDLAVQLIMKSNLPKTDTPTITVGDPTATDVTVTATATDPTAEVTLTIGDRTETGIGSVSITIDRGTADQNLTATATAQEDGKRVSDEATAPVYVPALPITATPVITYEVVGNNMVITATGNGTVTLEADGQSASGDGSAQIIIPLGNDERTVTATATAVEPNHQPSAPATETINIPEFGRSPMPNITMTNNGDGTYTITVTGTGDLAVYIDDDEHGGTAGDPIATGNGSVSFTVEEHSRAMTITVQATNQEGDLAISRTAEETYTIPAMSMNDFTLLDPQPENASSPIDMSKLMFVDRFSVDIPEDNSHPFMYKYTLKETQVRQRSSNDVEVYVEKTGSKGQGFYTLKQIDDDKDAKLTMDVENAAMDFNLSELSSPFFYTVEREEEADGESYWGWNAILQRTSIGNYRQTLKYDAKGNLVYNYNDSVAPGPHVQLDLDTITGDYNDYKAYVPVVWTMGFDRVNYDENNPTHNSYGASVWTTGVADVAMASNEAPKAERQTNSWNSVNWTAEGGPASLYILDNVVATATMPTVNTLEYEPYMFRIFVKSDNNKLRPYTVVPAGDGPYDGEHLDAGEGTTKGPICVWSGYINDPKNNQPKKLTTEDGEIDNPDYNGVEITEGTGDGGAVTYTFKKMKVDRPAGYDENHKPLGPWDQDDVNAMFGALDELANMTTISLADLEVFVRFYYIVKGTGEGHTPWIISRTANAESDPAGYGTQSPGKAPDPATGVIEIANHGEIVETIYYNMQGMTSDKPFDGINIVVNRYSDGAISVTKVITK